MILDPLPSKEETLDQIVERVKAAGADINTGVLVLVTVIGNPRAEIYSINLSLPEAAALTQSSTQVLVSALENMVEKPDGTLVH